MANLSSPEPFYSLARRAGDTLYLSAFGPVDKHLNVIGSTIETQTQACMQAIGAALTQAGASFDDLVCVDVFLKNLQDRDGFNREYAKFFANRAQMPARRLYGAGDLFKGILVEITGIAYLGEQKS